MRDQAVTLTGMGLLISRLSDHEVTADWHDSQVIVNPSVDGADTGEKF